MTKICDRCGDCYDEYIVIIPDSFPDIVEHFTSEYDNLCKPCRAYLYPGQAFTDAQNVEPKVKP